MPDPVESENRRVSKGKRRCSGFAALVSTLLLISLALHLWLAGQTRPVAPQIGNSIHPPTHWREQRVRQFRVATYNIHRGKGLDGVRDLARIAAVLKGADIVGINEAAGPSLFGQPNQVAQLAAILHTGWLFAANQQRWYRDYFGNGLLSRFRVTHWFSEPLIHSESAAGGLRNLITARIPIGGETVTVMVTHLDPGPIRGAQLRYVLNEFGRYERVILLGDLNTGADDPLLRALFDDRHVIDAIDAGLRSSKPAGKGDWIITRGFRVLGGGMTPAGVSDHPAFWVDLGIERAVVSP
jgi:endonuclease/exonuclease/phosphatase family metal-dependent hydrolase